jgi:hypothetical protein
MEPVRAITTTTSTITSTTTATNTAASTATSSPETEGEGVDPRIVNRPTSKVPTAVDGSDGDFVFPEQRPPAPAGPAGSLLTPCRPLAAPGCGLLAAPGLSTGLLSIVEGGQMDTDAINAFLDARLEAALEGEGPGEVAVGAGELTGQGGARGGQRVAGGAGCSDGAVVRGWRVAGRSQGGGALRYPGAGLQVRGWLQGELGAEAEVVAEVEATYVRDLLVKCLPVTSRTTETRVPLAGRLGVGVRLAARDLVLDYRGPDTAELSLTLGLRVEGVITGLEEEAQIQGCLLAR